MHPFELSSLPRLAPPETVSPSPARGLHQRMLTALAVRAMRASIDDGVLWEAATLLAEVLGADLVEVVQLAGERAPRSLHHLNGAAAGDSSALHALARDWQATPGGPPVHLPALPVLQAAGLAAGAVTGIATPRGAWGALCFGHLQPREYGEAELDLLRSVATLLGAVAAHTEHEEDERRRALHDALTGLPDRALLQERLARIAFAGGQHGPALLFCDVDGLGALNERAGQASGDRVLRTLAQRLAGVRPRDGFAARIGGDELALLVEDVAGPDEAADLAARVSAALSEGVLVDGRLVAVTVSMGVAVGAGGALPDWSPDVLVQRAERALRLAKAGGAGRIRLHDRDDDEEHRLEQDITGAAERGELVLHLQPVVTTSDARQVGGEVLVRWQHPVHGLLGPDRFIPLAEANGAIETIGQWVLAEACRRTAALRHAGSDLRIAVNISARQFSDALPSTVAQALHDSGLPPEALTLELTESVLLADADAAVHTLRQLKALGVRLHLDDFGTGYSSLAYLQRLPLDGLKIDRSFVSRCDRDSSGQAIIRAIVALAQALDLEVVAEGVETTAEAATVRRLGAGLAQGYLYGFPRVFSDQPLEQS